MNDADSAAALEAAITRYNDAWNAHDLDAIMAMHAPDMVFENHTAHERAEGADVRAHIGSIFETWPDIRFDGRRTYVATGWSSRSGRRRPRTRARCAAATWSRRRPAGG